MTNSKPKVYPAEFKESAVKAIFTWLQILQQNSYKPHSLNVASTFVSGK